MSTAAEVRLWGRTIAAVAIADGARIAEFEYAPEFIPSGIEVSPITMPLAPVIYRFPELAYASFYGLPGLLADSLPDKFGNALIDTWLASQGRPPGSMNPVERLCYTGRRGMGALEFSPASGPRARTANPIRVEKLVELASAILTDRDAMQGTLQHAGREESLRDILRVGTSAGGARAKAVIAWNPVTQALRSGQIEAGDGFEYWLLKFDGVQGNRDRELDDPQGYGRIEFAYHRMAVDCGIDMHECRLLEENGRHHFMTRRFDRTRDGEKLHMQTLGALAHFDFNVPGAHGYEQAFLVIRQLELGMSAVEQQFRRMVFNIVARNQDDHVKNIAFLMNKQGQWSLAPAFDVVYSFNPVGAFTARHQMTMNGKRGDFELADFRACARSAGMKRGRAETILGEVRAIVARWRDYADEVGVRADQRDRIQKVLRLAAFD